MSKTPVSEIQRPARRTAFAILAAFILLASGCRGEQPDLNVPPAPQRPSMTRARLRVRNIGAKPIRQLVVAFLVDHVRFGDIEPGEMTEYRDVMQGVFGAVFGFVRGGKERFLLQNLRGEQPSDGNFTYNVVVEPHPYLQTELVRLVHVVRED